MKIEPKKTRIVRVAAWIVRALGCLWYLWEIVGPYLWEIVALFFGW